MKLQELKQNFVHSISGLYPSEEVQSFFNLLAEKHLNLSRIEVALQWDKIISEVNILKFENALQRLKNFEPIQYIIGETEFFGMPFKVDKNVLIPRPETEELVLWLLESVPPLKRARGMFSILDIGTGSGCIPIALASELPKAKITAVDISEGALEIAKQNAKLNEVNINFIEIDILNSNAWNLVVKNLVSKTIEIDCIVSNPPYIRELERELMQANVIKHEPATALFVKDNDALIFYRKIADFAQIYLKQDGNLFFEINEYLGNDVSKMLEEKGFKNIEIRKDIFGKDRMVKCNKL